MSDKNEGTVPDEMSLRDVTRFLGRAWKSVLAGGLLGGLLVGAYIASVPHKYGASAMVRMAEIPRAAPGGPFVKASVEPPALLAERLRTAGIYPAEVTGACRVQEESAPGEALVERLAMNPRHEDVLSFSVRAESSAAAVACATAIFHFIRRLQAADGLQVVDKLSRRLEDLRTRLAQSRNSLAALEESAVGQVPYLVQRDELSYLARRIDEITAALDMQSEARLVVPVHTSRDAVFPRRPILLLVIAVLAGMLAGFLVSAVRRLR